MFSWSQEAMDNLRKVATDAIDAARQSSGQWVNPLAPHVCSQVRYAHASEDIERYLVEAGVLRSEAHHFADTCDDGFYQVYLPRHDFLSGDQRLPQTVGSLTDSWYEEVRAVTDPDAYANLIGLIKRTGGLETDKIRAIMSRRCFTEPSHLPGFERFFSADRHFPISVCYPEGRGFLYDFNREDYLDVEWSSELGESLSISRRNLGMQSQRGDEGARAVVLGKEDIAEFMRGEFARIHSQARMMRHHGYARKPGLERCLVGGDERAFEAHRLVWSTPTGKYGGEWVFFVRARRGGMWGYYDAFLTPSAQLPELWILRNSVVDQDTFGAMLSSFRWLSPQFFRSLPARP